MNLLLNARDAIDDVGEIVISLSNVPNSGSPHEAIVSVRDNGAAMPAEVQSGLFEPFFTTKPPGEGTGLGLGTVKAIVEDSGGRIEIDSVVDEGTEVRIYLPVSAETQDSDAAT